MMKLLMIGSGALRADGVNVPRREVDVDLISDIDSMVHLVDRLKESKKFGRHRGSRQTRTGVAHVFDTRVFEFEIIETSPLCSLEAYEVGMRDTSDSVHIAGVEVPFACAEFVYTLKMSHRYLKNSPAFLKTMDDIHACRARGRGVIVDDGFYERRMAATYDYGHPSLNVRKEDFFTSNVPYVYDHDSIHRAVAVKDVPAYTLYMRDGADVMTDREKFDRLPRIVRLRGVLEESYVLALERAVIPHGVDPRRAFKMALEKVCTSITSGWFREFAWENYGAVRRMYDPTYVDKFEAALARGDILPYTGKKY